MLTENDAVELIGPWVSVGKEHAAGLQGCEKLCLPRFYEGGKEWVAGLGHSLLQYCCIVCHCSDILHASPGS